MSTTASRVCFALTGVFILLGGPRHPQGTMAEMLAHPDWVLSHLLVLAGFLSLTAALVLQRGAIAAGSKSAMWLRIATVATVLQSIEMVVHTAAVVDAHHLVAGQSTPVLTTHLAMAVVIYPVFGAALAWFIMISARERSLGSPWIAWLGVAGAVAHGLAAPLTVILQQEWPRKLFPLLALVAFWALLVAVWPGRPRSVPAVVRA